MSILFRINDLIDKITKGEVGYPEMERLAQDVTGISLIRQSEWDASAKLSRK